MHACAPVAPLSPCRSLGEERTLLLAMMAESAGFIVLSYTANLPTLILALVLIAIGYGLAVPCLTTLFANVPVQQGVMQGIAGFIDRFGQAFGPILGGLIYKQLGAAYLMFCTGFALAIISSCCLAFIGDGCLSWMRELCCYRAAQGYSAVRSADHDLEEEIGTELSVEMMDAADDDDEGSPTSAHPPNGTKSQPAAKAASTTHSNVAAADANHGAPRPVPPKRQPTGA